MWSIKSINLSNLGGKMGTEYTTVNWIRYSLKVSKAKEYAEKDFGTKIKWKTIKVRGKDIISSGDLGYVEYEIEELAHIT